MSLLLEALKKAELAKQAAQADSLPAPAPAEPALEPVAPVMTRERLPDISQPLEILTDDLPSSEKRGAESPRPALSMQEPESLPAPEPLRVDEVPRASGSEQRAQAQRMFQVKEMDYNPRRPFYITIAALVLVGAGYAGYVWWQLQPKTYVAATAQPAAAPTRVAPIQTAEPAPPAPATSAPGEAPARAPAAVPPGRTVIPPLAPVRAARAGGTSRSVTPRLPPAEASAEPAPRREPGEIAPIAISPSTTVLDPILDQAYQAFQRNDIAAARDGYQRVLAREPNSRDALLGMAAVDMRAGNLDAAEARYVRLLELNPRDSHAVAGLVALRSQLDPVALESRLKTMIAGQPEAAHLHFSLGNQYARQSRWPEAQAAFFKAVAADPENADYAFNLAVSLDQLQQRKPALEYYQRALELAARHPANFSRAQTQVRVQELSK